MHKDRQLNLELSTHGNLRVSTVEEAQSTATQQQSFQIVFHRNPRARRYVLRVKQEQMVNVTVPRGGSMVEAERFVQKNTPWIFEQFQKLQNKLRGRLPWLAGTEVYFRGMKFPLKASPSRDGFTLSFSDQTIPLKNLPVDLKSDVENHLFNLAFKELPQQVVHFSRLHGVEVRRITIRDQRTRWGSCSIRRTISLNWRLIQTPDLVRDYIILHELMHLRQMNHSPRFWALVQQVCPGYRDAEKWLKEHSMKLI